MKRDLPLDNHRVMVAVVRKDDGSHEATYDVGGITAVLVQSLANHLGIGGEYKAEVVWTIPETNDNEPAITVRVWPPKGVEN